MFRLRNIWRDVRRAGKGRTRLFGQGRMFQVEVGVYAGVGDSIGEDKCMKAGKRKNEETPEISK